MKKVIYVSQCYTCPLKGHTMDGMECQHPYWEDKGAYDGMIINQNNMRGQHPDKCPLRIDSLHMEYVMERKV